VSLAKLRIKVMKDVINVCNAHFVYPVLVVWIVSGMVSLMVRLLQSTTHISSYNAMFACDILVLASSK